MPFEDVGHSVESFNNVSSVSLISDSLISAPAVPDLITIFFTNSDPDGTPVGNNGLAQAPLCKQCDPNHLVVNGEGNFCNWYLKRK